MSQLEPCILPNFCFRGGVGGRFRCVDCTKGKTNCEEEKKKKMFRKKYQNKIKKSEQRRREKKCKHLKVKTYKKQSREELTIGFVMTFKSIQINWLTIKIVGL